MDKLSRSMLSLSEGFTLVCLKELLPKDAWDTVYSELHLEEVDLNGEGKTSI
jgi:hypothetical protein